MGNGKKPRKTASGGTIYRELKDSHGDRVRVSRVAVINTELCKVTCLDDSNEDTSMTLTKGEAAELVDALKQFIDDPEPAVKLV